MTDPKSEAEAKILDVQQVEAIFATAQARSRRIRVVTISLLSALLVLVCVAVAVFERNRAVQEQQLAEERQKLANELEAKNKLQTELLRQEEVTAKSNALVASGVFKASHHDANGALRDYEQALALDPNNPSALGYDGYLRFKLGQLDKAQDLLARAVQVNPSEPWNRYNFALVLWEQGKHEDAIEQLRKVIEISPEFRSVIAGDGQFQKFRSDRDFRALVAPARNASM